jgi:hypothetical protein
MEVLEMAHAGLEARGLGEERYLEPLFERAETLTNPALALLAHTDAGGDVEDIIRAYAAP